MSGPTCDDVDVGVEVLAETHGRAVPLKPIPELLLHRRRPTQSVQTHHLTHTHTAAVLLICIIDYIIDSYLKPNMLI